MNLNETWNSLVGPNPSAKVMTGRLLAEKNHAGFVEHVRTHRDQLDQIFTLDQIGRGAVLAIRGDNNFFWFGQLAELVSGSSQLSGAITDILPHVLRKFEATEEMAIREFSKIAQKVPEWHEIYASAFPEFIPPAPAKAKVIQLFPTP